MHLRLSQKINFGIFAIVILAMVSVLIAGHIPITRMIIAIALGTILATFLLGMYFSKKTVAPIQRLVTASQRIANGDFDFKVAVTSHDEVGELAKSFNQMSTNLMAMLGREKQRAAEAAVAQIVRRKALELEDAHRKIVEKSDELKKVNAELDSFVYTASHDLRAPLRGISSFATFLEEDYKDKLDEEGREYLAEIRKGTKMLQDLIEDLLNLSRISRIHNPYEEVSIKAILEASLERLRLYIKDHKAQVIMPNNFPTIKCDRIKITEAVVNLINNGIKFASKKPGVTPRIEIGCEENEEFYKFSFKDNGIGIDPKYHEQVFGIFRRLHTTEEYEGTGAGLTIVKKIIEEHKGEIRIESKEGEGAKFIFTIPKSLREKKKLGEILLEDGSISIEKLAEGLRRQTEQS